ncbi:TolC family protein [Yeosuana sp.]|uniref:TolC family protein n=1 Tax=Yeosuana sp. TaxID=2529388 RepID=UPI0040550918|tara:strand:+ start:2681 stop:4093 length:1413 start_codon:yes stop_codon:yes gene_type:complete
MGKSKFFYIAISFLFGMSSMLSQSLDESVLRFDEYLGYVKAFHPIVKQAELVIDESQAKLMKARGGFDPKIDVDYDRKVFKGSEYYDKLNATFKIPTWYGIELKGSFEETDGVFLNPENSLPKDGLYSAGVSFSIGEGLWINQRMASLKQAKLFREQAKADRDILVNTILYEAALVYFNWLQAYNETLIYENFLGNAQIRFRGVKQNVELGEVAAIDSIEARIVVNDRKLNLEKSKVQLMKARFELSNFLWLKDNVPVELRDTVFPDFESELIVNTTLNIDALLMETSNLDNHPKLQSLDYKYKSLDLERRLKANELLPTIDLQYNFLSTTPEIVNSFSTAAYKSGINISVPLFLRKERGELKLAKVKLQDTNFERISTKLTLKNKINAIQIELQSFEIQNQLTGSVIADYEKLLSAEERRFFVGESSLFLVNSRESKLIDAKLKAIELQNKFFSTKALLFNKLAVNPEF